jgi:hypothetical protein
MSIKFREFLDNTKTIEDNFDKSKIANRIINSIKSRLFSLSINDLEHIENTVNSSLQNRRINIAKMSKFNRY